MADDANEEAGPRDIGLRSSLAASMTSHKPTDEQVQKIELIRRVADDMCLVIDDVVPDSRERSLAKTHLEETVMWAVKGVVLPR